MSSDKSVPRSYQSRNQAIRILIGLALSGVCLALSLRQVDFSLAWEILKQARPEYVITALLSVMFNQWLKTWRWRYIASSPEFAFPVNKAFEVLMLGQWFNALLPFRVGDFARAYLVVPEGRARMYALGSIWIEKYLDLVMLLALLAVCVHFAPLSQEVRAVFFGLGWLFTLLSLSLLLLLWKGLPLVHWFENLIRKWFSAHLAESMTRFVHASVSSLEFFRHGRLIFISLCLSVLVWFSAWLNNHLTLQALGGMLPWPGSLLLLVLLMAGVSLPAAPGKIGVFEYIVVFTLGMYQIDSTYALSYAVLLHIIVYLPVILIGGWVMVKSGISERLHHASRSLVEANEDSQ